MPTPVALRRKVYAYYRAHGRHDLPWRLTRDPYKILVSEIMLQQTQVERVLPKYELFIKQYPNVKALAKAPLGAVLGLWVGLGYNRGAKFLHEAARAVAAHKGKFPTTAAGLQTLPGVGPYTAGAVAAFAYNEPVSIIETNIRTVFTHHYFKEATGVSDAEIMAKVEKTLDRENPREWYYALMDYGVYLKKTFGSNNAQSRHYTKQSKFTGSDRQIRGFIIRTLTTTQKPLNLLRISKAGQQYEKERIRMQLEKLQAEGMIKNEKGRSTLVT